MSGPVFETLDIGMSAFLGQPNDGELVGWDDAEWAQLQAKIAARKPFLDFAFSRVGASYSRQHYRVSGEPMFNEACRFTGYRGSAQAKVSRDE